MGYQKLCNEECLKALGLNHSAAFRGSLSKSDAVFESFCLYKVLGNKKLKRNIRGLDHLEAIRGRLRE